ncbi:MarR family transcriptional regulator [Actibacterium mucosum KCTC 23349]|uniref:MarR family transcriptional regulator n=2 Tax=Actibacterium TaxID=1433986 RepID=A0A037ZMG0_9RHOB|nr:MarR family transcriptional regulator [Actibacterium mucosum]KAJ57284.1 MarR family transcriptional regulator [Actibacterium mucosum KCTC 23349]
MSEDIEALATALFGELLMADQLARGLLGQALPKGMELNQFSVLNHLARTTDERTPAQLAQSFHVTRGAMTNTLRKLETAGYVHIRPDWDDARRKMVSLSPSGRSARDAAIAGLTPLISDVVNDVGVGDVRAALPVLRALRQRLLKPV